MAATKKQKMQEAKRLGLTQGSRQPPRLSNLVIVNGEVVSREDLNPEPGEGRQYRRQFQVNYHE